MDRGKIMAKKFRMVGIILIAVTIVILTSVIWNKYNTKNVNAISDMEEINTAEDNTENNAENNIAEGYQKSVYDTNQYQSYKQFTRFIYEFPPEALEYKGEISIDGTDYCQYGNEDIIVKVISPDTYFKKDMRGLVDYTVSYRNETFTFQDKIPQYPEDLIVYYVDINKDNTKDVIIKCTPYRGSNIAYYWMRAVNLIRMEEIEIFKADDFVRLTTDQSDTLNKMLEEDTKFQSLFPDYEWLGNYANTMVDCFGNIYYEVGMGKEISYGIGQLLLLFDYNKITRKYDLVDYEYIPEYVFIDR